MNRKKSALLLVSIAVVIFAVWTGWENVTVGVTHYTVASDRLPQAFNHFKIVVVSDFHNAEFGKENDTLIKLIEKEKPDIIAFTGDLVDSRRTDIETAEGLVRNLAEIAPCCYVTGNHEARLGEQYQKLEKILLEEDVVVLHDGYRELTRNNETILIAGLDDPNFTDINSAVHNSILKTKLDGMNLSDSYFVLLSHRPEAFEAYTSAGVDLVLSGHAHGGQFRLPFIGGIAAPNQGLFPKYDGGMYSENHTTMIVSRGVGNSIFPVRINNRPEIVCVELICDE